MQQTIPTLPQEWEKASRQVDDQRAPDPKATPDLESELNPDPEAAAAQHRRFMQLLQAAGRMMKRFGQAGAQAMPTPAAARLPSARNLARLTENRRRRIDRKINGMVVRTQLRGDWPTYQPTPPTRGRNAAQPTIAPLSLGPKDREWLELREFTRNQVTA